MSVAPIKLQVLSSVITILLLFPLFSNGEFSLNDLDKPYKLVYPRGVSFTYVLRIPLSAHSILTCYTYNLLSIDFCV